jgi:hypothetical protein
MRRGGGRMTALGDGSGCQCSWAHVEHFTRRVFGGAAYGPSPAARGGAKQDKRRTA